MGLRPLVVISAHCDDAVLSFGACIAAEVERGRPVRVVTVFGNDEDGLLPLSRWDSRAGFETSSAAARARRAEDEAALAVLGAEGIVLPFGDSSYRGTRDQTTVLAALRPHLSGADEILVPGFPLVHADHRWLAELDYSTVTDAPVQHYVEQPYAWWNRTTALNRVRVAAKADVKLRHLRRKLDATSRYRSQLPLLGGRKTLAMLLVNDLWGAGEGLVASEAVCPGNAPPRETVVRAGLAPPLPPLGAPRGTARGGVSWRVPVTADR